LTTKQCHAKYLEWLQACEALGVRELQKLVHGEKEQYIEEYEEQMRVWKDEVAAWSEST
jgi:hypothetical protein